MHTYQQSAYPVLWFTRRVLINKITGKPVNLVDYQIPTAKVKITDTEVYAGHDIRSGNQSLQTILKRQFDIIINPSHSNMSATGSMAVGVKVSRVCRAIILAHGYKNSGASTMLIPLFMALGKPKLWNKQW